MLVQLTRDEILEQTGRCTNTPQPFRCFIPLSSSSQHPLCIRSAVSGPELGLIRHNLICRIDCISPSQYQKDIIHFRGFIRPTSRVFQKLRAEGPFGRWEVVGVGDPGGALRCNNMRRARVCVCVLRNTSLRRRLL